MSENNVTKSAFQFKVTMDFEELEVWRKIIVPADISFKKFHYVLQDSLNWLSYHLYDFRIFDHSDDGEQIAIVCDNDDDLDEENVYPEKTLLRKFIPEFKRILYSYDYGDGWLVKCELEKVIEDYPSPYPVCIEGSGDAPPDDVGSEGGFIEFLNAINDKKHSEHEEMVEWGKMQQFTRFNLDKINTKLLKSLKRRK